MNMGRVSPQAEINLKIKKKKKRNFVFVLKNMTFLFVNQTCINLPAIHLIQI